MGNSYFDHGFALLCIHEAKGWRRRTRMIDPQTAGRVGSTLPFCQGCVKVIWSGRRPLGRMSNLMSPALQIHEVWHHEWRHPAQTSLQSNHNSQASATTSAIAGGRVSGTLPADSLQLRLTSLAVKILVKPLLGLWSLIKIICIDHIKLQHICLFSHLEVAELTSSKLENICGLCALCLTTHCVARRSVTKVSFSPQIYLLPASYSDPKSPSEGSQSWMKWAAEKDQR